MSLRIRQIVLATRDLESTVVEFRNALGLQVVYRDPLVAQFGLENAILRVGNQFLEIVSPTRDGTAAGRHLERHGDSAYMLILQTDDLAHDRERIEKLGIRIIWQAKHDDIAAIQLHPKDVGGAIVSFDEATPAQSWRWAGPNWQREAAQGHAHRIVSATIATRDPQATAQRWSEILDRGATRHARGWQLPLDQGELAFVAADGAEGIVEFGIEASPGTPSFTACGTIFSTP